jgi:hypothetical protein
VPANRRPGRVALDQDLDQVLGAHASEAGRSAPRRLKPCGDCLAGSLRARPVVIARPKWRAVQRSRPTDDDRVREPGERTAAGARADRLVPGPVLCRFAWICACRPPGVSVTNPFGPSSLLVPGLILWETRELWRFRPEGWGEIANVREWLGRPACSLSSYPRRVLRKPRGLSTCDMDQRRSEPQNQSLAATFGDSVRPLGTQSPIVPPRLRRDQ